MLKTGAGVPVESGRLAEPDIPGPAPSETDVSTPSGGVGDAEDPPDVGDPDAAAGTVEGVVDGVGEVADSELDGGSAAGLAAGARTIVLAIGNEYAKATSDTPPPCKVTTLVKVSGVNSVPGIMTVDVDDGTGVGGGDAAIAE